MAKHLYLVIIIDDTSILRFGIQKLKRYCVASSITEVEFYIKQSLDPKHSIGSITKMADSSILTIGD